jgi:cell shape-determining protein MreC
MTESDGRETNWRRRLMAPSTSLVVLLAAAGGMMALPTRYTDALRTNWEVLLAPAQRTADNAIAFSREHLAHIQAALANADQLASAEQQVKSLTEQNAQLTSQLRAESLTDSSLSLWERARVRAATEPTSPLAQRSSGDGENSAPLLNVESLPAHVLGQSAQSFLRRNSMLDVGSRQGVMSGELVIDVGHDLGAQPGRMVLSGRRIYGKLAAVGAVTSSIQRLTDAGYRDRVQLAHGDDAARQLGAQGMLVGAGESLCRIELIETSQPVSVGDDVYAAGDGTLTEPLLYGRIVRAEHVSGQPHWQLWMAPALAVDPPQTVEVLKLELNPARVAKR